LEDGPPGFPQGSSCPVVLGYVTQRVYAVSLTGLSPSLVSLSRTPQLQRNFVTPRQRCNTVRQHPSTPYAQRSQALTCTGFGLFPLRSPLLGESLVCFLFLRVLRWFTSPRSPLASYFTQKRISQLYSGSLWKIRISPDHSLFAALRGFSQLTTSFFAFLRQGIHRMPLVA
jgi:hypothetical protein